MEIESKILTIIALIVVAMFIVSYAFADSRCTTWCDDYGCYTTCRDI